mmetsp:Transcript_10501/g.12361  ORF Transcript_10501/g.12361 Transcript_10501/m.12361 type:complete len:112 (+) Transcript_10501:146-481(+)
MKTLDDGNCRKIYRLTELITVPLEAHGRIIKETLADTFNRINTDHTGCILQQYRRYFSEDYCTDDTYDRIAYSRRKLRWRSKKYLKTFGSHFRALKRTCDVAIRLGLCQFY